MRKLVYGINITLDGNCDHIKGNADEETHDYFTWLLRNAGVLLYGRKTYELMVPFWPDMAKNNTAPTKALADFAQVFDSLDKVVFSTTLEKVDDAKTRIISGDLHDEIVKLKQQDGKDLFLGGVDLPSQLIAMGLVDDFVVVVHPCIAGDGRRMMEGVYLPEQLQLKLVESKVFKSGSIALRYVKGKQVGK
jgi:dihydrofolate reductase